MFYSHSFKFICRGDIPIGSSLVVVAREVEQAVAVVLVILIPCLDLGGEAVGQRCREGVEAVKDIDDLPLGGDGWGGNLDSR